MKRLAVVALFLLAACGSINTVQAHSISLAYKAGDTYNYALHFVLKYTIGVQSMSIPLDLDLSGKETVKVKSVDSSGVADATVTVSDLSAKTTVNGTTNTTTTASTTVEVKVGPDGRVISVNGSAMGNSASFPGMSGSDSGLVSAILPDKPVKPGDTWTKSYDEAGVMGSTGTFHVTSDNKYVRDEKVSSINTAVVESKINANLDLTFDMSKLAGGGTPLFPSAGAGNTGSAGIQGMTIKGTTTSDVTSWIDSSARHIVKSHSTGSVDATLAFQMEAGQTIPGLTGPITFKGTQTLDMNPA
jgi:hypothetical protein